MFFLKGNLTQEKSRNISGQQGEESTIWDKMSCINGCMIKSNLIISLVPYFQLCCLKKRTLLVLSWLLLSHMTYLQLRKKWLFVMLSKFTKWLFSLRKKCRFVQFSKQLFLSQIEIIHVNQEPKTRWPRTERNMLTLIGMSLAREDLARCRIMSIFTFKKFWKFLIQIQQTKSNPKITWV